jgi:hypothetical protein
MAKNIIIFRESTEDVSNTLFGFKIVESKLLEKYISLINKLSNKNAEFDFGYGVTSYDIEKFEVMKLSSVDVKYLEKLFDIDGDNLESSSVGIFPDVFNDAYEIGLIDDLDDDEEDF